MASVMQSNRLRNIQRQNPYPGGMVQQPQIGLGEQEPFEPSTSALGIQNPFNEPRGPIGVDPPYFGQPPVTTPDVQDDASRYYELIKTINSETTPGLTAYQQALKARPQEEDYKPNWMTRIAAGLSGLSAGYKDPGKGVEVANTINRSPYINARAEYESNLGNLKEQAVLEQADRNARLKAIMDAKELGLKYEQFQQTSRYQNSQAESSRIRANAAAANAAKQDYDYLPVMGGFQVVNKHDPKDSSFVAAKTIAEAQLKISQQNADAATSQAATAAGNLRARENEFGVNTALKGTEISIRAQDVASRVADRLARQNSLTINEVTNARQLALSRLATNPMYTKFTDPNADFSKFSASDLNLLEQGIQNEMRWIIATTRR